MDVILRDHREGATAWPLRREQRDGRDSSGGGVVRRAHLHPSIKSSLPPLFHQRRFFFTGCVLMGQQAAGGERPAVPLGSLPKESKQGEGAVSGTSLHTCTLKYTNTSEPTQSERGIPCCRLYAGCLYLCVRE